MVLDAAAVTQRRRRERKKERNSECLSQASVADVAPCGGDVVGFFWW